MLYSTAQQLKQTKFNSSNQYATTSFVQEAVVSSQAGAGFRNLKLSATGLSSLVTITADKIELDFIAGTLPSLAVSSVSLTPSLAVTGVNGLDTGTSAASTWYSVWVISNGTTTSGLLSLSATTPTMPSGYTYRRRVGWVRTDSTANKYPLSFIQYGSSIRYKVASGSNITGLPIMASGVQGNVTTPTWVSISVSAFVPVTASHILESISGVSGAAGTSMTAPNNSFGSFSNTANPPPHVWSTSTASRSISPYLMMLESMTIYFATDIASQFYCIGWEDVL